MYKLFPLADVPPREKFDRFVELVDEIFCPMQCLPYSEAAGSFDARIEARDLGNIHLAQVRTTPVRVSRRRQDIGRMCDSPYLIKFQLRGRAFWSQCGKVVHLRPGDFVICSTSEPYTLHFDGPYQMPVLVIAEPIMRRLTPDPNQFLGRRMSRDDAACSLLCGFVAQVVQRMSALPEPMIERVETNILDLLGGVLSAHSRTRVQAHVPREQSVRNIKGYVKANLRNRRLGPEMIAKAFGVSTRHVHKIFAEESLTLNRYIRSLRLEACYQSLTEPKFAHLSITDIALYWGFYDLPHMTRCFRKTYCTTPKGIRSNAHVR
jgi:AraC-like DNA-binding protein